MRIALFAGVPISVSLIKDMSYYWEILPAITAITSQPEPQRTDYKPLYVKPLAKHRLMTKSRRQSVNRGK